MRGGSSAQALKRIGIFGGSFDPVHLGHLLVAQAAWEELCLDRLVFVPAAQSPFKPDRHPAPSTMRLRMLRLALAGRVGWEVDEQEILRGGVSYSIDTVRNCQERHPDSELFYLIGADHVGALSDWKEADELARLLEFVVIPRPGQPEVSLAPPFRGRRLKGVPLALSSSEIRERIRQGRRIDHLTPGPVAEVISNYRLYL